MTLALTLVVAGVAVPLVDRLRGRAWALAAGLLVAVVGAGVQLSPVGGGRPTPAMLVVAGLVWCGPAADIVVRAVLEATRLPAPEAAAEAGLRAGRWIGRLERWLLVLCVAAGEPTLAVLPIGGKALFRYAEVVADARADAPRLERTDGTEAPVTRSTLIDYVIVGSLASWVQAIALGLLAA